MSYPKLVKQKFIELRAAGLSFDKIAAAIHVSKPVLLKWSEEFAKEIAAEEYVKAEALMVKHRLYRQAKLEDMVEELARVRKAVKSRDLTKVNFTALLEMEGRHEEEIGKMIADLQKCAGLNSDGEKQGVTPAMIAEINKAMGMDI
jgi:RNA-binding protein YhbY